MPRSKSRTYLHVIWTTRHREPTLKGVVGRAVGRCIHAEVERQGGAVIAMGGLSDHVHLLVRVPPIVTPATLVKQGREKPPPYSAPNSP